MIYLYVEKTKYSFPYGKDVIGCKGSAIFWRPCKVTKACMLPLSRAKDVFTSSQESCHFFFTPGRNIIKRVQRSRYCCHMVEILWDNCKSSISLAAWEKCPPCLLREMLLSSHDRAVLLVLQNKCGFCHMAEMCRHVTKKMLLHDMAEMLPSCYKRNVMWAKWHECSLVLRKCNFGPIAEMLYTGRKRLQLILHMADI